MTHRLQMLSGTRNSHLAAAGLEVLVKKTVTHQLVKYAPILYTALIEIECGRGDHMLYNLRGFNRILH